MKRSNRLLAFSSLALTLVFASGCIAATEDEDTAQNAQAAQAAQALLAESCEPGAPTFEVTALDDGGFRFVSVAIVDRPIGAVWAKLHNFEKLLQIFLPDIASDFHWVDGGNPGRVPSRFQFMVDGVTLLEEVFYRSHQDRVLQYRLVTPALGIDSYIGTLDLDKRNAGDTVVTFSREMYFADPALVHTFSELLQLEMLNMQAYFANGSN